MKNTTFILVSTILSSTLAFSQITIKAPKFGKNKEEKKAETSNTQVSNAPTETSVKQTETVKSQESVKKEEPTYYNTNYPASMANGKNYTIKSLEVYRADNEWVSMHMKLEAEDGSKLNESYFEHYKNKDKSYYERSQSSSFIFPLENGSYLLTSGGVGSYMVANLISINKEHITNAPSKEDLLSMAKILVAKIKDEEVQKKVAKNDEDFKKINQASKNVALETQFKVALTKSDANLEAKYKCVYKRVTADSQDWTIVKNDLGVPLKKTFDVTIIGEDANKQCFYFYGSMKKEYIGGGKYSDVIKFNQGNQFADGSYKKYISCGLVK